MDLNRSLYAVNANEIDQLEERMPSLSDKLEMDKDGQVLVSNRGSCS